MYPNLFTKAHPLFSVIIIIISTIIRFPTCLCVDDDQFIACGELFECANIPDIGYPFWGGNRPEYCGHAGFQLSNCGGDAPLITIQSRPYRVIRIENSTRSLTVAREDLWNTTCINYLYNTTTLDPTLFSFASTNQDVSLHYDCTQIPVQMPQSLPFQFNCNLNGTNSVNYFTRGVSSINTELGTCNHRVIVPVNERWGPALGSISASMADLTASLRSGFGLEWAANETRCQRCETSGGRCGSNWTSFACYCADQPYPLTCAPRNNRSTNQLQIVLPVVGAILAGIGIGWLIFFCRQRRKRLAAESSKTENKDLETTPSSKGLTTTTPTNFTRSISSYSSTTEFGKGSTYFGVQVFNYTELEEATDNFDTSRELGDGGFGTVYYAKLPDGREVAVKRLYENNFKRVEQFMNEVEILTRLQHQYLVKLYGCTSKRSRELLLVYEYISNGTVGDHLHGKQATSGLLSWPVRLNIAVETAEALTYLHASDIIHRDVKTNNILLDDGLRVKVADFGLSRLFPNDATHVSTAPQGTPGYVDPEYYQCYQLTDKSDVYSFGVVLIELISSLQAVDTNRHRHDINLANMAINKIQNHGLSELVDMSLGFETDNLVRRMITLVAELAFRCLQQEKDLRPSMKEVLDTLGGIQNEELSAQKAEVVDILVDDGLLLNGNNPSPPSPDFMVSEKLISSSAPNSTG